MFRDLFKKKTFCAWVVDDKHLYDVYKAIYDLHEESLYKGNWLPVVINFSKDLNKCYVHFVSKSKGYDEAEAIMNKLKIKKITFR